MSNYFNYVAGLRKTLKRGRSTRPVMAHITVGLQLAITVLVFVFGGYKLDTYYHKSPLFVALGAFIGMGIGFYSLLKELNSISRREKEKKESSGDEDKKRIKWM